MHDKVTNAESTKELFSVTGEMLGASSGKTFPSLVPTDELPDTFNHFFNEKIETIRDKLDSNPASGLVFPDITFSGMPFDKFKPVSVSEVKEVIELPIKHPELFESLGISQPKGSSFGFHLHGFF